MYNMNTSFIHTSRSYVVLFHTLEKKNEEKRQSETLNKRFIYTIEL